MGSRVKILITMCWVFVLSIVLVISGIAYAGGMRGGAILGTCFFFTLGIAVVLAQAIPAIILSASLTGTVFSSRKKTCIPTPAI
jgi:hypothetical protein